MTSCLDSLPLIREFGTSSVSALHVDGRLIRKADNSIFRVKGLTAFPYIDRYKKGQDVDWIQSTFPAANLYRVFWYTPQDEWGDKYWDLPTPEEAFNAHAHAADRGIYLYNSCLTNAAPSSKIDQIKAIIKRLRESSLPNILFEAKNEPYVHDDLNPSILKNALNSTSPYLYTCGIYEWDKLTQFWGTFGNNHCSRDAESVRKFKDLEDLYGQVRIPWFEGEPFKLPGYPDLDFYTFAAGTGFMGSGGIYHCQSMEYLNQPNADEIRCGTLFLQGLDVFPLATQLGDYDHLDELEGVVNGVPTTCLRCYRKGKYAIVVRKNDNFKVPSNWKPIDSFGVAWEIQ